MYSIPVGYNNKVMSPSLKFYDFESLKLDKKITFFARSIHLPIHILTIFYLFIQRGFRTVS